MKQSRIHVRVDEEMKKRLAAAVRKLAIPGVDEAAIVRGCLEAFVQEVEEKGGIWLPIAFRSLELPPKKSSTVSAEGKREGIVVPPVPLSASPSTAVHGANETSGAEEEIPLQRKPVKYSTGRERKK